MVKDKSRMFSFIDKTFNPLGGECIHSCTYCWSKAMIEKYRLVKYVGPPKLDEKALGRKYPDGACVFLQDMNDLLADNVPLQIIEEVLRWVERMQKVKFLSLTKNPRRYCDLPRERWPRNIIFGATVESNRNYPMLSKAPPQFERLHWMQFAPSPRFVSIEPVLDFDLEDFASRIENIKPWAVAVGYNNYPHLYRLPEPERSKTKRLIKLLEEFTVVYVKTLRERFK